VRLLVPVAAVLVAGCAPASRPVDTDCAAAVEEARALDARLDRIDAEQHALVLEWMKRLRVQGPRADAGARRR